MSFDKLYKALVIGGATLTMGACGSTSTSKTPTQPKAVACDKACSGTGQDMICPDPKLAGSTNCCWLMLTRHACCPGRGGK